MNKSERVVAENYESQGWEVVRGGAPDFLFIKRIDGLITEVETVEVKTDKDKLKPNQQIWAEVLRSHGIPFTEMRMRSGDLPPSDGEYASGSGIEDLDWQSFVTDHEGFPILFASQPETQFVAYCPWCERAHYHAAQEGHRIAHCFNNGPFDVDDGSLKCGYVLVKVGVFE